MIRGNSWEPSLASLCSQLFGVKDQAFLFLNTTRDAQSGTKSQRSCESKMLLAMFGCPGLGAAQAIVPPDQGHAIRLKDMQTKLIL